MAFGDLTTGEFASGLALSGYDRALAGVAGRVTTGAVVWQGFGSTSSERLAQQQIRGAGMSGPYDIGLGIVAGTEKIVLETRAFDNPQQALARQTLTRYLDYDIDYEHGLLLFKHPVPATDPSGNPVFIMLTYGTDNGGAESTINPLTQPLITMPLDRIRALLTPREVEALDFGARERVTDLELPHVRDLPAALRRPFFGPAPASSSSSGDRLPRWASGRL